jgi:hypothetical protein
MKPVELTKLLNTISTLVDLTDIGAGRHWTIEGREVGAARAGITLLKSMCADSKLAVAHAATERLLRELDTGTVTSKALGVALDDIRLRMIDELTGRLLLELSPKEAEH